jgi:hypothetical protein
MTSTQHRLDERTLQQVVCERIEDRVAALREPSTTHVTAWVLSADRLRLEPRPHVVEHPSLLEQLELAVSGTSGPASGAPGYESKPAIRVEALDTLASIEREAASFVRSILHHLVPGGVDQHLAFLVARAPTLRSDDRRTLDEFVLRWWARARVTTTWDSPAARPFVPCPACDRRGTIRLRAEPLTAVCVACGAAWDEMTIGVLGNHFRIMTAEPIILAAFDRRSVTW